ncbi:hypothetical protein ACQY0O_001100 [Thecaphora frezii]
MSSSSVESECPESEVKELSSSDGRQSPLVDANGDSSSSLECVVCGSEGQNPASNAYGGTNGYQPSNQYPTTSGNHGDKTKGGSGLGANPHSQQPSWAQGSGTTDNSSGQSPSKVYKDQLSYTKEDDEDGNEDGDGGNEDGDGGNEDGNGGNPANPDYAFLELYDKGYPIDQTPYLTLNKHWYANIAGKWYSLDHAPKRSIKTLDEVARMFSDDTGEENQADSYRNGGGSAYGQYNDLQEYGRNRNQNSVDDNGNTRSGDNSGKYDGKKYTVDGKYHTDADEDGAANNGDGSDNKQTAGDLAKENGGDGHGNGVNGSRANRGHHENSQETRDNGSSNGGKGNPGSTSA